MADRKGIMLCYPFEEKRILKWGFPVIVQAKLDGDRCRALPYINDGSVRLLSSTEHVISSMPQINAEMAELMAANGGYYINEYDGELYKHGMSFDEIHSRVSRTVNLHPDYKSIEYHIFDIICSYEQHMRARLLLHLRKNFEHLEYIKIVPTAEANSMEELMKYLDVFMQAGYEGFVVRRYNGLYVRKRSVDMVKFKPRKSDTYDVVGRVEEVDKNGVPKGTLGAIICKGDDDTEFRVGSGFTQAQREIYWHEPLPKRVVVLYQHITKGSVPRFPVFFKFEVD